MILRLVGLLPKNRSTEISRPSRPIHMILIDRSSPQVVTMSDPFCQWKTDSSRPISTISIEIEVYREETAGTMNICYHPAPRQGRSEPC